MTITEKDREILTKYRIDQADVQKSFEDMKDFISTIEEYINRTVVPEENE